MEEALAEYLPVSEVLALWIAGLPGFPSRRTADLRDMKSAWRPVLYRFVFVFHYDFILVSWIDVVVLDEYADIDPRACTNVANDTVSLLNAVYLFAGRKGSGYWVSNPGLQPPPAAFQRRKLWMVSCLRG
jgi:hypothetical protein